MDRADARAAAQRRAAAACSRSCSRRRPTSRGWRASRSRSCRSSTSPTAASRERSSPPATSAWRTARSRRAAPTARSSRTTRSSGTRWSGSPARARTSTATAARSAPASAAARRLVNFGRSRADDDPVVGNANLAAARHEPAVPVEPPPYKLDGAVLPPGAAERQRPAGRSGRGAAEQRCRRRAPLPEPGHDAARLDDRDHARDRSRRPRREDRDPQAPARLHRDRRARPDRRLRRPLRARAPAHDAARLGADLRQRRLRAQGRVLDRAGDHAGPGADGRHRRRAGRRDHEGRPRQRPRDRDDGAQAEVRAPRPPERDDAAAPEDGPEGHDRRARTPARAAGGPPVKRRLHGARSRTRSRTSTSTRSSRCSTATRARTCRLLLNGAATGLESNGGNLAQVFRRFEPTARDAAKFTKLLVRSGASTSAARSTTSASSRTRSPRATSSSAAFVDSSNDGLPALREPGREPAAHDRAAAGGAARHEQRRCAQAKAFADQAGPALGALRPGARALGPVARRDAAVLPRDDADHPATSCGRSREWRRRSSRSCGRPPPTFADATPTSRRRSEC